MMMMIPNIITINITFNANVLFESEIKITHVICKLLNSKIWNSNQSQQNSIPV